MLGWFLIAWISPRSEPRTTTNWLPSSGGLQQKYSWASRCPSRDNSILLDAIVRERLLKQDTAPLSPRTGCGMGEPPRPNIAIIMRGGGSQFKGTGNEKRPQADDRGRFPFTATQHPMTAGLSALPEILSALLALWLQSIVNSLLVRIEIGSQLA